MLFTRREFLVKGAMCAGGILFGGCSPRPETPQLQKLQKIVTAFQTPTEDSSKIESLPGSAFKEQAFNAIYEELKNVKEGLEKGALVIVSNIDSGRSIFLKDPNKKPFYDTPVGIEPAYGEVMTIYRKYKDPVFLWPLAQEYKTLGFLNVFLISSYQDFPGEGQTLKTGARGQISAEATVVKVLGEGSEITGIEVVEVHYSVGKPIFRCTSQFEKVPEGGFAKIGEKDTAGQKTEEYFFLWPVKN